MSALFLFKESDMAKWKFEVCTVCGVQDDNVHAGLCPYCKALQPKEKEAVIEEKKQPPQKGKAISNVGLPGKKK